MLTLKGQFADAAFDPATSTLTITRKLGHKSGKGSSSVSAKAVTAVNCKMPTTMFPLGFVEFVGSGLGDQRANSWKDGQEQMNVITFKKKRSDDAQAIIDAVRATSNPMPSTSQPPPPPQVAPPSPPEQETKSVADELTKLMGLRDAGVLSDDEFEVQKSKLLG